MGKIKHKIDPVSLRSVLSYDKDTGIFTWKSTPSNRVKAGTVAGCFSKTTGYIYIGFQGMSISAHRLAWIYVTGENPEVQIDHKDTIKTNNKFSNLRLATNSQNKMNSGKHRDNTSGFVGVFWERGRKKWRAVIMTNGKRKHLGLYNSKQDAADAYDVAATKYHGKFSKTNRSVS